MVATIVRGSDRASASIRAWEDPGDKSFDRLALARIESVESPCELADGLDRICASLYGANEVVWIDPGANEMSTLAVPEGPTIWRLDPDRLAP
jgi:hypothetical protein